MLEVDLPLEDSHYALVHEMHECTCTCTCT